MKFETGEEFPIGFFMSNVQKGCHACNFIARVLLLYTSLKNHGAAQPFITIDEEAETQARPAAHRRGERKVCCGLSCASGGAMLRLCLPEDIFLHTNEVFNQSRLGREKRRRKGKIKLTFLFFMLCLGQARGSWGSFTPSVSRWLFLAERSALLRLCLPGEREMSCSDLIRTSRWVWNP